MSSRSGSQSEWTRATRPTPVTRTKRSSAYDNGFEQHLVDNKIYPKGYDYPGDSIPKPRNMDDINRALLALKRSLSPSRFPHSAFEGFERANDRVISEGRVMSDIVPTIRGNSNIPSNGNLVFINFDSMTRGATTNAVPDFYDGAPLRDVNAAIRRDLSRTIIPTNHADAPVAPNFFLEAKARKGGADVARRQACYDGAYGIRAMHVLQNYGRDEPIYDGNAYSYSSTYHAREASLQLYAHATAPATLGDPPAYHMTRLRTYAMADTRDSFVSGATAFRNARDLAQSHRDRFIQEANARAQARPGTSRGATERQLSRDGYGPSASSSSYDRTAISVPWIRSVRRGQRNRRGVDASESHALHSCKSIALADPPFMSLPVAAAG